MSGWGSTVIPHFKSIASGKKAPEETGCEGCHGPGDLHVKGMGDKSKIVRFPELPPNKVLDECLRCHAKDFGKMYIRRSSHSTGEVSCISCHSIHKSPEPQYLLADKERNVCYGCHADIRARFDLPFKHRVNEGAVDCSDCHNPHGAPMATWGSAQLPRMVSHGLGNDVPCVKCHSDKRGPFAFEHRLCVSRAARHVTIRMAARTRVCCGVRRCSHCALNVTTM